MRLKPKKSKKSDDDESDGQGRLAKTPWAEAVRLERPLYVTPGTYKLLLEAADGKAETDLVVDAPEPRKPRLKPEPKIRGQQDDED